MDGQRTGVVVPMRPQDGPLACLAGGPMAKRFCAWRGASDRRYVATIYPVDRDDPDAGLPEFSSFLLLAIARSGASRRVLDVAVIERTSSRRAIVASRLAQGADEWHVHFLADEPAARAATAADLRARHCRADTALCA